MKRSSCPLVVPTALALAGVLFAGMAQAQAERLNTPQSASSLEVLKERDKELETVRAEQKRATEIERKLRGEIDRLGEDRRKLNQTMIETAARIRTAEQNIAAIENRLDLLDNTERGINGSLEGRREVIGKILAALQRIGRNPPPALLVRPEDVLQSLRSAILLGAVLPELRNEADVLAADLADLVRVRREAAAERARRTTDLAALSEQRTRMGLLIEERQRRLAAVETELATSRQRAMQLALQVDNLKDLIARLEANLDASERAARNGEEARQQAETHPNLAALKDPGRLSPAIAFASAKGGTYKGMSVTTRPGAQVTAPCDGWVVYAAPYRSYGQLLILNAGGGYHVLLAGMDKISVDLGQFVLIGEPLGVMGSGGETLAGFGTGGSRPVLYIEFRKDGLPVDPSPWWATNNNSEKVRG
jgi:septal ring factor EnvC (AmiA/AmiB activator)